MAVVFSKQKINQETGRSSLRGKNSSTEKASQAVRRSSIPDFGWGKRGDLSTLRNDKSGKRRGNEMSQ